MNDLMRPALYDAWHDIVAVSGREELPRRCEVVGPACESGDFLGHERMLAVHEGDMLAVMSAGAYGIVMSSNYNSRPLAAEVMVDGEQVHLVRKREEIPQLFAGESALPEKNLADRYLLMVRLRLSGLDSRHLTSSG